eukprot:9871415-Alexandrium_andersonii.AAC.1
MQGRGHNPKAPRLEPEAPRKARGLRLQDLSFGVRPRPWINGPRRGDSALSAHSARKLALVVFRIRHRWES